MSFLKNTFKTVHQAKLWKDYLNSSSEATKDRAKNLLLNSLKEDKGLTMKFGQLFVNQNKDEELFSAIYTDNCRQVKFDDLEPLLIEEFGANLSEVFEEINRSATTASLGQVHFARLKDKVPVAIKIQYPGIKEEVHNQLTLFGIVPNLGPTKRWGVPIDKYKIEFRDLFINEVSYLSEAKMTLVVHALFYSNNHIATPNVHQNLSSDWILVQDWMNGQPLVNTRELDHKKKLLLGDLLADFFLTLLFSGKMIQTDFHLGNFKWKNEDGNIILQAFDFGAVRNLTKDTVQNLVTFLYHADQKKNTDPLSLLTLLGFDGEKLKHIGPPCGEIVRLLSEPFLDENRYNFKNWNLFSRMKQVLGEDHWWFRSAGSPEFMMLMKSINGLIGIFNHLGVEVCLKDKILKLGREYWNIAQNTPLKPSGLKIPTLDGLARRLHVKITENGLEKVDLSLAITCVYDLESLIEPEVLAKIDEKGVQINDLVHSFLSSGAVPGTLFEIEYENKAIKVWAQ